MQHDALGRRTAVIRPNGVRSDWAFDDASEVTSLVHSKGGAALLGLSYDYDSRGMRTKKTREDGSWEGYGLDAALRLNEARYSSGRVVTFTLDSWGNRSSSFDSAQPTALRTLTYTVNGANETTRVASSSTVFTDYGFDGAGNTVSATASPGAGGGVTSYAWNRDDRLTSVSSPTGGTSYQYGATGLRAQRVDATGTTNYLLDGNSVLAELDGAGAVTTRYLNNPQVIDDVFAQETASGTWYPLTDALGSVYALTDGAGAIVRRQDFEVYGERSSSTGTGPATDRGFTGRWHDGNGLIEHRDRERNPKLGGWLQPDRAGKRDGPNLYLYGSAAPTVFADPNGRKAILLIGYDKGKEVFHYPSRGATVGQRHTLSDSNRHSYVAAIERAVMAERQRFMSFSTVFRSEVVESKSEFYTLANDVANQGGYDEFYFSGHAGEDSNDAGVVAVGWGPKQERITADDLIAFLSIAVSRPRAVGLFGCATHASGLTSEVALGANTLVVGTDQNIQERFYFADNGYSSTIDRIEWRGSSLWRVEPR